MKRENSSGDVPRSIADILKGLPNALQCSSPADQKTVEAELSKLRVRFGEILGSTDSAEHGKMKRCLLQMSWRHSKQQFGNRRVSIRTQSMQRLLRVSLQ